MAKDMPGWNITFSYTGESGTEKRYLLRLFIMRAFLKGRLLP
jgi:hypothetical protein